jgi:hypothetical protein
MRNPTTGRPVSFGVKGMADILAFKLTRHHPAEGGDFIDVFWIELKADGNRQSEFQKSFQAQVEAHGHTYIVARSLEGVIEVLK